MNTFNPSTEEAKAGVSVRSRPTLSTLWVPEEPGLHKEKNKQKKSVFKINNFLNWQWKNEALRNSTVWNPENSDFTKGQKKKQSEKTTHYVIPPVSTVQWGQTTGMGNAVVAA